MLCSGKNGTMMTLIVTRQPQRNKKQNNDWQMKFLTSNKKYVLKYGKNVYMILNHTS